MSVRASVANWPLAWKAPLLAAGLLVGVAFVISQIVLNRLESDQENNLRHLTSAYLDGLSAAVLPSAIHGDVWEAFAALDRARDRYAGLNVRFAIVALPNEKVLAASDLSILELDGFTNASPDLYRGTLEKWLLVKAQA